MTKTRPHPFGKVKITQENTGAVFCDGLFSAFVSIAIIEISISYPANASESNVGRRLVFSKNPAGTFNIFLSSEPL